MYEAAHDCQVKCNAIKRHVRVVRAISPRSWIEIDKDADFALVDLRVDETIAAIGDAPASYIYYKDVNRAPL
jgi:glyoxylate utilization-related uncharacterized protein